MERLGYTEPSPFEEARMMHECPFLFAFSFLHFACCCDVMMDDDDLNWETWHPKWLSI